ncbi:MAG: hypothetical protein MJZ91_07660 [Bacteroidales bacterium]|nr:hypothetical protein [Bacteroidales bacterium]
MKRILVFVLAVLSMSFSSCSIEKRYAKSFIEQSKGANVAVYFPETAKVTNSLNVELNRYSEVLEGFNQNVFLDIMYAAYAETLRDYDLNVYIPDNPDNIPVDSVNWLVMLTQVEITGKIVEYDDYMFYNWEENYYKHNLNGVNVASWFDMNNGKWLPVQFAEHNLIDGFKSKADAGFSQSMNYTYTIDTLSTTDLYNYAAYLGKLYAGYTFDCFMNHYIVEEAKKDYDMEPALYMRYDPYRKMYIYLYYDETDKFVEIK